MGCGGNKAASQTSKPARMVSLKFSWPESGSVTIKTLKFRVEFDAKSKDLVIKLSDRKITESELTWENGQYSITDVRVLDRIDNTVSEGSGLQLQFSVDEDGRFQELLEVDSLLEQLLRTQKVSLPPDKAEKAKQKLTKEARAQWKAWVEVWLSPHKVMEDVDTYQTECVILTEQKKQKGIEEFLGEKFGEGAGNILIADAGQSADTLIEVKTVRPLVSRSQRYRYLCFDLEGREVREMWDESVLTLFCWEDIEQLRTEEFLKTEVSKQVEIVSASMEEMHRRVASLEPPADDGEGLGDLDTIKEEDEDRAASAYSSQPLVSKRNSAVKASQGSVVDSRKPSARKSQASKHSSASSKKYEQYEEEDEDEEEEEPMPGRPARKISEDQKAASRQRGNDVIST